MTVKELIVKLAELDGDLPVHVIDSLYDGEWEPVTDVHLVKSRSRNTPTVCFITAI